MSGSVNLPRPRNKSAEMGKTVETEVFLTRFFFPVTTTSSREKMHRGGEGVNDLSEKAESQEYLVPATDPGRLRLQRHQMRGKWVGRRAFF